MLTLLPVMENTLNVGDPAPQFTSTAVGGKYGVGSPISLADYVGQNVVLYFYPKDGTPGCTTQACGVRDSWNALSQLAVVFGVSPDGPAAHQKFIDKYELPFPLISDESKEIAQAYNVWVEKSMYGKTYLGVERSTFVIGADGKLKAIFRKVKPAEHVEALLSVL